MIVDSSTYNGLCTCGREHAMVTRAAIIESGAMKRLEKYLSDYAITGKRCALYGGNGFEAVKDRRPEAEQVLVLDPVGLHADEKATAKVLELMDSDVEVIIAIGSGTIHDIARFCAHERGIRFVSVPTGASVDGFCSTVAAMTWYGFKKTMPAVAPEIVVADTDIIKNAPFALAASGVGDIMAKYTALADWRIAHELTGEYLCERIYDIMKNAADTVMENVPGLMKGEDEAFESLTYALVMSGLAMQMIGNSRPASASEHHISHMTEMEPAAFPVAFTAMHGEKCGVGSIVAAREYKRLAEVEDIASYLVDYAPVPEEKLASFFGEKLASAVIDENRNDCLAPVSRERLAARWSAVRDIIAGIPAPEELYALLEMLDAKRELAHIGIEEAQLGELLEYSPLVRNRLTLMRARRMIKY